MPISRAIFEQIKRLIPPLDGSLHKGESGRVGVLGGALEYTGAPFFAAISAQRLGADLSHVICSTTAAGPIKSYSPDLIVHPISTENISPNERESQLQPILSRLHVLIIGPGLGREHHMQSLAKTAIHLARKAGLFIVLDADGLYLITNEPSLIRGYRRAVITPNIIEFKRLSEQLGVDPHTTPSENRAELVSRRLGGVTVLQKGPKDIIATDSTGEEADSLLKGPDKELEKAKEVVQVDIPGGLKRCGGQGDILSGAVGTFMAWGKCYENGAFGIPASRIPLLAAIAGSMVTRTTSRLAFQKLRRSVVTQDMLSEIGKAFEDVFEDGQFGGKL